MDKCSCCETVDDLVKVFNEETVRYEKLLTFVVDVSESMVCMDEEAKALLNEIGE